MSGRRLPWPGERERSSQDERAAAPPESVGGGRWAYSRRRLLASLWDLPVVLAWAAVAAVVGVTSETLDVTPRTPAGWDAIPFLTLIVPVTVTLALAEASTRQASPGKRHVGLFVADRAGRRLGRGWSPGTHPPSNDTFRHAPPAERHVPAQDTPAFARNPCRLVSLGDPARPKVSLGDPARPKVPLGAPAGWPTGTLGQATRATPRAHRSSGARRPGELPARDDGNHRCGGRR
jgi:hypothetical protein